MRSRKLRGSGAARTPATPKEAPRALGKKLTGAAKLTQMENRLKSASPPSDEELRAGIEKVLDYKRDQRAARFTSVSGGTATQISDNVEKRRALLKQGVLEARKMVAARAKEANRVNVVERELAARLICRRHLLAFLMRLETGYLPGWVHKDIASRLERFSEAVARGESPRLMIQMPPRHGKSTLASHYFPAWHLGQYPRHEIIISSYSGGLATMFSRKIRALLRDPAYNVLFPGTQLDPENQNAEGWLTTKGGGLLPAGLGGGITGRGADCLIIDDPVKNAADAQSLTMRDAAWEWYASTAYTRLVPGGGVLVIQTKWSTDDLSGRLEERSKDGTGDKFEIIRYPAIAEERETYRRKGEALHPQRFGPENLERIRRTLGPALWSALYQQSPTALEGEIFTRDMIHFFDGSPPDNLVKYATWDLAIGKGERNDWTVGMVAGVDEKDNLWFLDMYRGRWDSFEIVENMLDAHEEHRFDAIGIEQGQLSMAIGPFLDKRIEERGMYDIYLEKLKPGRRDKTARARAIQGRMKQGKVFFPRNAPWVEVLLDELMTFPAGTHDDVVDAVSWMGLMLQDMNAPQIKREPKAPRKKQWRERLKSMVKGGSFLTA